MQWRTWARGQRWPNGSRLAAKRFIQRCGCRSVLGWRGNRRLSSVYGSALGCDRRWFLLGRRNRVRLLLFNLLRLFHCRDQPTAFRLSDAFSVNALPYQLGNRLIDRTGVRLLFGDADLRQHFYDHVRWNLQLPRQLVDADFAHIQDCNALVMLRLADFPRILYGIKFFFGNCRIIRRFRLGDAHRRGLG